MTGSKRSTRNNKHKTRKPIETVVKVSATKEQHRTFGPLLDHSIGRLLAVMRQHGEEKATPQEIAFGSTAFVDLKPETPAEMMLIQQMIGCYEVAMEMLTRAKQATGLPQMQESGNQAVKLMGMFERLNAALIKGRKPTQVVTVEHTHRHVHVNASGIPTTGVPGDTTTIEGQAHGAIDARTLALTPSPAMLGQDAPRHALPITSDTERPVSNARRRAGKRST
jgi:hypothetical protein